MEFERKRTEEKEKFSMEISKIKFRFAFSEILNAICEIWN